MDVITTGYSVSKRLGVIVWNASLRLVEAHWAEGLSLLCHLVSRKLDYVRSSVLGENGGKS